jgi:hypothetical protein
MKRQDDNGSVTKISRGSAGYSYSAPTGIDSNYRKKYG